MHGIIFLIGFMGSGKTTVGRALAGMLGVPFADTDEMIAARKGMPVSRIFEQFGEPCFRDLE
ncbi:MAG: shikimate kinase, partial [Lachnospiraceae bacterium]|nr:shikimate kinase [Lachnospiraceae bacterium]